MLKQFWNQRVKPLFTENCKTAGGEGTPVYCETKDSGRLQGLSVSSEDRNLVFLGDLTRGAAHDLNNILSGLVTYPDVLLMDDSLDPSVRAGLMTIRDAGRRAGEIVEDLLSISRSESGDMTAMNINQVVENYLESLDFKELAARYPGIEIVTESAPDLLWMRGSIARVEKCLESLLSHSMEEIKGRRGAGIGVITANQHFSFPDSGCSTPASVVCPVLTVCNNGPGFDDRDLARLFEPFYITKQMGREGSGLGLTLVKHLVMSLGGEVRLESGDGGTRFDLYFPPLEESGDEY